MAGAPRMAATAALLLLSRSGAADTACADLRAERTALPTGKGCNSLAREGEASCNSHYYIGGYGALVPCVYKTFHTHPVCEQDENPVICPPSAPPPSPPPSASPSPPPSAAPSPPPSLAPSPPPSVATTQPTVTDPPATDPPSASSSPPPSPAPSPPLTEVETTVTLTATADGTLDEDAVVQTLADDLGVDPERITLVPSFDGTLDEGAEANVTVVVKVEDDAEAEAVEKELNALDDGEKTDAFGDSFKVTAVAEVVVTAPAPSPPPAETQTCDCEDANKSDDCASTCDAIVAAVGLVGGALIAVIAVPIVVVGLIGLLVLYCCCCKGDSKQPTPTAEVEMPAAPPTESHV